MVEEVFAIDANRAEIGFKPLMLASIAATSADKRSGKRVVLDHFAFAFFLFYVLRPTSRF